MHNVSIEKFAQGMRIKTFDKPVGMDTQKNRDHKYIKKNGKRYKVHKDTGEIEEHKISKDQEEINLMRSVNRTKSKIYDYAMSNNWVYWVTLTLDKKQVDRYDLKESSKKLRKWIKNIKNRYAKDMTYLIIPEPHKDGAWHFHALIGGMDVKTLKNAFELKFTGKINDYGIPVDRSERYTLGKVQHWELIRDSMKASNYITKYITKELLTNSGTRQRYFVSQNCKLPEIEKKNINNNDLKLLKIYLEKKTLSNKDTYRKCIEIKAPGYENQLEIYNFPSEIDINNIDYNQLINKILCDYFTIS